MGCVDNLIRLTEYLTEGEEYLVGIHEKKINAFIRSQSNKSGRLHDRVREMIGRVLKDEGNVTNV